MNKTARIFFFLMTSVGLGAVLYLSGNEQSDHSSPLSQDDVLADTATTKHFFDFSLSRLGEENLGQIVQEVSQSSTPELNLNEQEKLFSLYLNYKQALAELEPLDTIQLNAVEIEQLHLRILQLQERYFSPSQIEQLFAEENLLRELAISKMRLNQDNFDAKQQRHLIEDQLTNMPDYIRTAESNNQLIADLESLSSLDNQTRYLARVELVGSEGATRLQELDLERTAFQTTLEQYLNQREALLMSQTLTEQDKLAQLSQLRMESFDPIQIKRVEALERIHDQNTGR